MAVRWLCLLTLLLVCLSAASEVSKPFSRVSVRDALPEDFWGDSGWKGDSVTVSELKVEKTSARVEVHVPKYSFSNVVVDMNIATFRILKEASYDNDNHDENEEEISVDVDVEIEDPVYNSTTTTDRIVSNIVTSTISPLKATTTVPTTTPILKNFNDLADFKVSKSNLPSKVHKNYEYVLKEKEKTQRNYIEAQKKVAFASTALSDLKSAQSSPTILQSLVNKVKKNHEAASKALYDSEKELKVALMFKSMNSASKLAGLQKSVSDAKQKFEIVTRKLAKVKQAQLDPKAMNKLVISAQSKLDYTKNSFQSVSKTLDLVKSKVRKFNEKQAHVIFDSIVTMKKAALKLKESSVRKISHISKFVNDLKRSLKSKDVLKSIVAKTSKIFDKVKKQVDLADKLVKEARYKNETGSNLNLLQNSLKRATLKFTSISKAYSDLKQAKASPAALKKLIAVSNEKLVSAKKAAKEASSSVKSLAKKVSKFQRSHAHAIFKSASKAKKQLEQRHAETKAKAEYTSKVFGILQRAVASPDALKSLVNSTAELLNSAKIEAQIAVKALNGAKKTANSFKVIASREKAVKIANMKLKNLEKKVSSFKEAQSSTIVLKKLLNRYEVDLKSQQKSLILSNSLLQSSKKKLATFEKKNALLIVKAAEQSRIKFINARSKVEKKSLFLSSFVTALKKSLNSTESLKILVQNVDKMATVARNSAKVTLTALERGKEVNATVNKLTNLQKQSSAAANELIYLTKISTDLKNARSSVASLKSLLVASKKDLVTTKKKLKEVNLSLKKSNKVLASFKSKNSRVILEAAIKAKTDAKKQRNNLEFKTTSLKKFADALKGAIKSPSAFKVLVDSSTKAYALAHKNLLQASDALNSAKKNGTNSLDSFKLVVRKAQLKEKAISDTINELKNSEHSKSAQKILLDKVAKRLVNLKTKLEIAVKKDQLAQKYVAESTAVMNTQWRDQPRVHVFDSDGCFDFNFMAYNNHIFGYVSKNGIKSSDMSAYDFYFVESGVHFFGYEQSLLEGDKISMVNMLDAMAEERKPDIQEILAEQFKLNEDFDFKSGKCFDYNFIQGGVNCFGMYTIGDEATYDPNRKYDYDFRDADDDLKHYFGQYCPDTKIEMPSDNLSTTIKVVYPTFPLLISAKVTTSTSAVFESNRKSTKSIEEAPTLVSTPKSVGTPDATERNDSDDKENNIRTTPKIAKVAESATSTTAVYPDDLTSKEAYKKADSDATEAKIAAENAEKARILAAKQVIASEKLIEQYKKIKSNASAMKALQQTAGKTSEVAGKATIAYLSALDTSKKKQKFAENLADNESKKLEFYEAENKNFQEAKNAEDSASLALKEAILRKQTLSNQRKTLIAAALKADLDAKNAIEDVAKANANMIAANLAAKNEVNRFLARKKASSFKLKELEALQQKLAQLNKEVEEASKKEKHYQLKISGLSENSKSSAASRKPIELAARKASVEAKTAHDIYMKALAEANNKREIANRLLLVSRNASQPDESAKQAASAAKSQADYLHKVAAEAQKKASESADLASRLYLIEAAKKKKKPVV